MTTKAKDTKSRRLDALTNIRRHVTELYGRTIGEEADPLLVMAEVAFSPTLPLAVRAAAAKELAPYIHPKHRSIEVEGGQSFNIQLVQFADLAEDERLARTTNDNRLPDKSRDRR